MSTPRYRDKDDGSEVEAVQFVQADPRTHWHINIGDLVSETLGGAYWTMSAQGPVVVNDGDWIVRRADGSLGVKDAAEFAAYYEILPEIEA